MSLPLPREAFGEVGQNKIYTIGEAAKAVGVSISTLRRWDKAGKIKIGRKSNGYRCFTQTEIELLRQTQIPSSIVQKKPVKPYSPYSTLSKLILKLINSPVFLKIATVFILISVVIFYSVLTPSQKGNNVLGIETLVVPAIQEEGPIANALGRAGGILNFFKGRSFVVPLLGADEGARLLDRRGNIKVAGSANIAKDIEGLGNLNIKGTAIVGKLITGIIDPYLIENDGAVQPQLEIRTAVSISHTRCVTECADIVFEPGGIEQLRIKEGGDVTFNGNVSGINSLTTSSVTTSKFNITGDFSITGTINGNTLSSTKLVFGGTSPSIYPSTSNTSISLNASGTGAINIGNSGTGDVYIAGGSSDTGCTITNSNGSLNCSNNITSQADIDIRGGDLTTNVTTFNLINTTATTLNVGGASTTISIGASTGTTTVNNALTITGAATLSSTLSVTGTSTFTGNLTINGRPTFTKVPTSAHTGTFTIDSSTWNVSDASIYINPTTATADSNLLGVAVNGNVKFDVDAEGDVFARNLVLTGNTTTGTTTVSGDLTVEGNTTLGDATTDTFTVNTATLTWAGGNKTIDLTGAATRTLTLLNSTVSQVADLDLSDGSLLTAGTSRLTNAGVLQNITGLTVSSGTVSLPNDQIDPSEITQGTAGQLLLSNATPDTAWTTLSGDATLAGTGALTLANSGVTANTYGGSTAIPVITVDAKGRLTTVTTASISSAWSSITDPTANLSLAHGANTTTFTWNAATGASTNLFNLADTTNNTGTGYILSLATASGSNALPLRVAARGNTIIDTTATGGVTIGNATSAQAVTVDAGTATLNVGNSNNAKTINIGTGTAADTINIGSGGTTADTITIGGLSGTTINITGTVNITGAIVGTSTVQGTRLISTVATGTAPLTVTSTTQVTNLNASLLEGNTAATISPVVDVQTFTANGTWTKPANAKWIRVVVIGGGGGGGGGEGRAAPDWRRGAGAGGGGAYIIRDFDPSTLGSTETVTVGSGGTAGSGGTTADGTDGGSGGNSSFGSHVTAYAGGAGDQGGGAQGGGGGGGGAAAMGGGPSAGGGSGGDPGGASPGGPGGNATAFGGGGGGTAPIGGNAGGNAVYGGGGGAGGIDGQLGGSSLYGGPAGGSGGAVTNASPGTSSAGGAGGTINSYTAGGGAAGGSVQGGAGNAGTSRSGTGKSGGGGGGGAANNSGTGGAGGAGGAPGGGGGGGAGGTSTGGAGGAGARGEVLVYSIGKNTLADLAEEYRISDTSIEAGDVVKLVNDPQIHDSTLVGKTNKGYDGEVLGIISTNPSIILGDSYPYLVNLNFSDLDKYKNTNIRPVALQGRVPVKVTNENGIIRRGDILTSSATIPGYAMKATKAGRSIGIAMDDFIPTELHLGGVTEVQTGKVMTFVNLSWYDPDVYLADSGQFEIKNKQSLLSGDINPISNNPIALGDNGLIASQSAIPTPSSTKYQLTNVQTKEIIERTGAFNKLFVANLKVGNLDVSEFSNEQIKQLELRLKNLELATQSAVLSASISALLTDNNSLLTTNASSSAVSSQGLVVEQLSVLGRTILNDLGVTGKVTAGLLSIDGLESSISSLNDIKLRVLGGEILIDKDGNLKVQNSITAKKYYVDSADLDSPSLGGGVIPAGTTSITISTTAVTDKSRIFVTAKNKTGKQTLVVSEIPDTGFIVSIEDPYPSDISFNWWIVDNR